jgi:hypothetical protein
MAHSPLKINHHFRVQGQRITKARPWRQKRHTPLKLWLSMDCMPFIISQEIELFKRTETEDDGQIKQNIIACLSWMVIGGCEVPKCLEGICMKHRKNECIEFRVHSLKLLIYLLTMSQKTGEWQNKKIMFQYSLLHKHKTRNAYLKNVINIVTFPFHDPFKVFIHLKFSFNDVKSAIQVQHLLCTLMFVCVFHLHTILKLLSQSPYPDLIINDVK